jgi:hypothetical protein
MAKSETVADRLPYLVTANMSGPGRGNFNESSRGSRQSRRDFGFVNGARI